jgi:hypothetical protein
MLYEIWTDFHTIENESDEKAEKTVQYSLGVIFCFVYLNQSHFLIGGHDFSRINDLLCNKKHEVTHYCRSYQFFSDKIKGKMFFWQDEQKIFLKTGIGKRCKI